MFFVLIVRLAVQVADLGSFDYWLIVECRRDCRVLLEVLVVVLKVFVVVWYHGCVGMYVVVAGMLVVGEMKMQVHVVSWVR